MAGRAHRSKGSRALYRSKTAAAVVPAASTLLAWEASAKELDTVLPAPSPSQGQIPSSSCCEDSDATETNADGSLNLDAGKASASSKAGTTALEDICPQVSLPRRIVMSNRFDYSVCTCIIINAIMIGAQCEYNISTVSQGLSIQTPLFFQVAETIFCVLFTVELAVRMMCHGRSFFTMLDWKWNVFDTVIVTMQLLEVVLEPVLGGEEDRSMPSNFNFMRILRILRLVRIVRLVRVLRYVQELRTMVASIASSCKSLLWTIVLVVLLIYVIGVYLTNLVADHAQRNPEILHRSDTKQYYGSLLRTTLSLFEAMTGGVDWDAPMRPLVEEISPLLAIVFSLYVTFAVLCMMNVITGIFVESALATARADKEKEIRRQIGAAFASACSEMPGKLTWQEFSDALTDPKIVECFNSMEIDTSEAMGLFALLDTDSSGHVDKDELVMSCCQLRRQARAIDLATLTYFNKRVSPLWVQLMGSIAAPGGGSPACEECDIGSGRVSPIETRVSTGELHLPATWADLKAEGDRRVSELQASSPRASTAMQEPVRPSTMLFRRFSLGRP